VNGKRTKWLHEDNDPTAGGGGDKSVGNITSVTQ
jgi:hypothetical protein